MNIKRPKSIQKVLSFVITKQLTKPSKRQEEEKMTLSIVVQLVLLSSIVQFPTASSTCETNIVPNNIHNNARKFHLRDSRSNQYLIVESDTMLLRTVSSAEFEHFQQNEITWFTDCNGFTPIYNVNDDIPNPHFEICIAGTEDKRLFYDETFHIFMFLNEETRDTDQTPRTLMNMRLVQNVQSNSFEYASFPCSKGPGHLQLDSNSIGMGTETLLNIEE